MTVDLSFFSSIILRFRYKATRAIRIRAEIIPPIRMDPKAKLSSPMTREILFYVPPFCMAFSRMKLFLRIAAAT